MAPEGSRAVPGAYRRFDGYADDAEEEEFRYGGADRRFAEWLIEAAAQPAAGPTPLMIPELPGKDGASAAARPRPPRREDLVLVFANSDGVRFTAGDGSAFTRLRKTVVLAECQDQAMQIAFGEATVLFDQGAGPATQDEATRASDRGVEPREDGSRTEGGRRP